MVVCFRSISARTSEGIGTFNCWCCWRIGLCLGPRDVEKRLGPGVATTHATPASLGCPRRRIDTASRVSKSTPCVRCVQPWARRFITEPGARRRVPICTDALLLSMRTRLIAQELLGGCPPSSLVAARRRRGCQIDAARAAYREHAACARRSCTFGGYYPRRASAAAGRSPDATRVESPDWHSSERAGPAPRGSPGSSRRGALVPRLLVGRGQHNNAS